MCGGNTQMIFFQIAEWGRNGPVNEFIESLNEFHPTIKFTAEYSKSICKF